MIFPAYIAIHLSIGGIGMYTLCRVRKKIPSVSFFIAELVTLSGCFTFGMQWAYIFGSYCWIMWLLVTLYLLVETGNYIWVVLSGLVLANIGLCSSAHGALFAVMIYILIFGTVVWKWKNEWKRCLQLTGKFITSGFIGMGIASIQLFPFFETSIKSFRYVPGMDITESSKKIPLALFKEDVVGADRIMDLFGAYYGTIAMMSILLVLIIVGIFIKAEKEDCFNAFAKILLFGALAYSMGLGVCDILWYIPGYNAIRKPILYAPFIIMAVSNDSDGIFVTTEFFYPGWNVMVDGKKVDVFCANYAFRGVYLPAGNHIVEYTYSPMSLKIGIEVAILALMVLVAIVIVEIKKYKHAN